MGQVEEGKDGINGEEKELTLDGEHPVRYLQSVLVIINGIPLPLFSVWSKPDYL